MPKTALRKRKKSQHLPSHRKLERDYEKRLEKRFFKFWDNNPHLSEAQAIAAFCEREKQRKRAAGNKRKEEDEMKRRLINKKNYKSKSLTKGKGKKDREARNGSGVWTVSGGRVNPR